MTTPRPEPLTCESALERLDAAWLDPLPEEPLDADLLAAREHLQECSACWAEWERRHAADNRIGGLMQAVAVPPGLREQLLTQSMTETGSAGLAATSSAYSNRKLHRRAWWISMAAMLLVSAAGGSWLWQLTTPHRITMQTLCDQAPLIPDGLSPVVDLTKLPPLPASWPRTKGLRLAGPPCWLNLPNAQEPAGWLAFELRSAKSAAIRGVLLLVRQNNVSDPPAELLVRPEWSKYTQRDGKPVSVAGWSERGVVYLCFVTGEPASLERVLRATAPTAA